MRVCSIGVVALVVLAGCSSSSEQLVTAESPPLTLPEGPEEMVVESAAVCSFATGGAEGTAGQLNRETVDFEAAGGIPVILKRTPGNPVVAVRLYFAGGTRNLTAETGGVEDMALWLAANGGTESLDKAAFSARLSAMGSDVGSSTGFDASALTLSTLEVFLDESWPLFVDAVRNPAFPDAEIELYRQRQVQSIQQRTEDPDTEVSDLARSLLFADHPYANRPDGTVESVSALTRDQIVAHYESLFQPSRMLLIVVGDIDQARLEGLIGETFADLSAEGEAPPRAAALTVESTGLAASTEALPTNYIMGMAPAPPPDHADYAPLLLGLRHLRNRLFEEIRTERNLSYAVSSGLSHNAANYTYLYITTVDPAAALPVMSAEVQALRNEPLTATEVEQLIAGYTTAYYQTFDSNGAVAAELAWWALHTGDREGADELMQRLRAATPEDIQRVANEYLHNYQFGWVGPASIDEAELQSLFGG